MEPTAWVISSSGETPEALQTVLDGAGLRSVCVESPPRPGRPPFDRPALLVVVEAAAGTAGGQARTLRRRSDLAGVPLLVLIHRESELTDLDAPLDPMEAVRSPWNEETLRWRLSRVMRVDDGGRTPGQSARLALLEAVLDHIPDVVGISDMSGLHIVLNKAGRELAGLREDDPITRVRPQSFHPPRARVERAQVSSQALEDHGVWEGETEVNLSDGTVIPAHQMMFRLRDDEGVVRYTGTYIRDLRSRRALEHRLARAESEHEVNRVRLEAIAAMSPDLIGMATVEGKQLYLNSAGRRLLGYPDDLPIEGRSIGEAHPPESQRIIREVAMPQIMSTGVWSGETEMLHFTEGYRIPVWQVLLAPRDAEGKPLFLATFIRDLRDLRALEVRVSEAEHARARAEEAEVAKTRFLANMSHEIRTPLNAVLGYGQLLATTELTDTQDRFVDHIQDSGQHLLKLIDEILDLSRIEAGAISFHPEPVEVRTLLESIASMFTTRCASRNLTFEAAIDVAPDAVFLVDPQRMTQSLANLLDNAVKFTREGRVALTATLVGERLEVLIEDDGPGMTEEEIARATEPFHQGSAGQVEGGVGLGLAITRALIERMGGRLEMRPRQPVGLQARVLVDLVPTTEEARQPSGSRKLSKEDTEIAGGLLALVVDDIAPNRDVLREMLLGLGARVTTAGDGRSAIAQYDEIRPDFVFMDIRMPGLDGFETLEHIRARTPDHRAPIIAVTASVVGTSQETFRARGFADVIYKPVRMVELAEAIRRYHPQAEAPKSPTQVQLAPTESSAAMPEAVRTELLAAVELQQVSRIRTLLDELQAEQGGVHEPLVARMRDLLQRYDFPSFRKLLSDDVED